MTREAPGSPLTDEEFDAWLDAQLRAREVTVRPVPFSEAAGWAFRPGTGDLRHVSDGFFGIEGISVRDADGDWTQPIIDQPEIGILGILTADFDGRPHYLMQAKFEPGNVNVLQMSPTVQATRSNFTGVHGGRRTPYVEYFDGSRPRRVLCDVLQSEQGQWFWRKRNRNIVVRVDPDVPVREGFCWLSRPQVLRLLKRDNLVNMDARTVLACLPPGEPAGGDPLKEALALSRTALGEGTPAPAAHGLDEVLRCLIEAKSRCGWVPRLVPLDRVAGWHRTETEITDDEEREFRIIAARVSADIREVDTWAQPLLAPRGHGLAVLLAGTVGGVLHVLLRALPQPGLLDIVEFAPTVQVVPSARDWEESGDPFLPSALADTGVLFDSLLSEEGGRFHHAQTRYRVVSVGEADPSAAPEGYVWASVGQVAEMLRHGHYLNIEARTLVACLYAWGEL